MKRFIKPVKIILCVYLLICTALFFFQERLIFFPEKLKSDFRFSFDREFEEINIRTKDEKLLNGILFKAKDPVGVVFYLHGNAGSLASWGWRAALYTQMNYDVFMIDYRGYGKSEGHIRSQEQFFRDIQDAYDVLKKSYTEEKIVVLGYSIGTGAAAWVSSVNHPKLLVLQAPYYSLTDMMHNRYPAIPTFLLKYKFRTNEYLPECQMPIVIFHGDADEVIDYEASVRLKRYFKTGDTLITLEGEGHNGITENIGYIMAMKKILAQR